MVTIKRFLDIGAQSILIPYVQNADEAKSAVAYTRYPPAGCAASPAGRGDALCAREGLRETRPRGALCARSGREPAGPRQPREIAAVEGVDGVFIGPADLHASLGYPGETNNPKIVPIIDDAIRRIRKAGKGRESSPRRSRRAPLARMRGLFVAVGADVGVLARETEKLAAKFKS